jgi:transposase
MRHEQVARRLHPPPARHRRDSGHPKGAPGQPSQGLGARLLERKPARLVSVALANKTARIAWAVLSRNQSYVAPAM